MADIDKALRIAELALKFGEVDRATLHPDGRHESDTTHTVMLALLAIEFAPDHIDPMHAAAYAIVHDLLERWTLDVCTAWGLTDEERDNKRTREAEAMVELEKLGLPRVTDLLRTYEHQQTKGARFVRYLDKITPKLTHLLNKGEALRWIGMRSFEMRAKHEEQGQQLASQYPEQREVHELFADACSRCETELSSDLDRRMAGAEEIESFCWEEDEPDEWDGDDRDEDHHFVFVSKPEPTPPDHRPTEQQLAAVAKARDFFAEQRRREEESAKKAEQWATARKQKRGQHG